MDVSLLTRTNREQRVEYRGGGEQLSAFVFQGRRQQEISHNNVQSP